VLGDAQNRRAYDNARKDSGFGNYRQEEPTTSPNGISADWELVKKYHPEAENWRVYLSKLSQSLAFTFQVTVLENKLASNAHKVVTLGTNMKSEFLERYFGKNQDIQLFAHEALVQGRSDVAKEVNRAITVLGTPPDKDTAQRFIRKVQNSMNYNLHKYEIPPLGAGEVIAWTAILFFGFIAVIIVLVIIGAHVHS
jgi:hypothetical protein